MQAIDLGEQLGGELVQKHRPVERTLSFAGVSTELFPGDTAAVAVGLYRIGKPRPGGGEEPCHRGHEVGAVGVSEDIGVGAGEREADRVVAQVGRHNSGDRLMLQPLPGIAFDRGRAVRQLGRGQRAFLGQDPVPAESVTQIQRLYLGGATHRVEDLVSELGGARDRLVEVSCHGSSPIG